MSHLECNLISRAMLRGLNILGVDRMKIKYYNLNNRVFCNIRFVDCMCFITLGAGVKLKPWLTQCQYAQRQYTLITRLLIATWQHLRRVKLPRVSLRIDSTFFCRASGFLLWRNSKSVMRTSFYTSNFASYTGYLILFLKPERLFQIKMVN